jgi:hypothetical protein
MLSDVECVETRVVGEHLIVEIVGNDIEPDDIDEDGEGWLAALAPLRASILSGDLRMFYLLWLTAVAAGVLADEAPEPLPGLGPLDGALDAFAEFFWIDPDLVEAAAERSAEATGGEAHRAGIAAAIGALPEEERLSYLSRLYDGDSLVGFDLRRRVRDSLKPRKLLEPTSPRTAGEFRARAAEIAAAREQAAEAAARAECERLEKEAAQARKKRLAGVAARGEQAWREVEQEIERRNAAGYDRAAALLADLRDIAQAGGDTKAFERRIEGLGERHARKGQFIVRLRSLGIGAGTSFK